MKIIPIFLSNFFVNDIPNNNNADAIITIKSITISFPVVRGLTTADNPKTNKILQMFEPTTFPIAILALVSLIKLLI